MKRTNADWQKKLIARLLKQETGRHFLDSGSAYGRHWERNANKTDEDLLAWDFNLEVRPNYFQVSRNIANYLYEAFDFDRHHTTKLMEFSRSKKFADENWYTCLRAYIESVGGDFGSYAGNTYNRQSFLTQCIAFEQVDLPDRCGEYYAVCIHQGCDIRGGYGEYFIAEATDEMHMDAHATLYCKNDHQFYTDDTYRWYPEYEPWGNHCYTDDDFKIASNAHSWWVQCPICKCKLDVHR